LSVLMTLSMDLGSVARSFRQGTSAYSCRTASANSCRTTSSITALLEANNESTFLRQPWPFSSRGPNSSTMTRSADFVAVALSAVMPSFSPLAMKVNGPVVLLLTLHLASGARIWSRSSNTSKPINLPLRYKEGANSPATLNPSSCAISTRLAALVVLPQCFSPIHKISLFRLAAIDLFLRYGLTTNKPAGTAAASENIYCYAEGPQCDGNGQHATRY